MDSKEKIKVLKSVRRASFGALCGVAAAALFALMWWAAGTFWFPTIVVLLVALGFSLVYCIFIVQKAFDVLGCYLDWLHHDAIGMPSWAARNEEELRAQYPRYMKFWEWVLELFGKAK